jgi:hypothetical protein
MSILQQGGLKCSNSMIRICNSSVPEKENNIKNFYNKWMKRPKTVTTSYEIYPNQTVMVDVL